MRAFVCVCVRACVRACVCVCVCVFWEFFCRKHLDNLYGNTLLERKHNKEDIGYVIANIQLIDITFYHW